MFYFPCASSLSQVIKCIKKMTSRQCFYKSHEILSFFVPSRSFSETFQDAVTDYKNDLLLNSKQMISVFHSQEVSKPQGQISTWCVNSYHNLICFTVLLLSHVEKDVKLSPQLFLKATRIGLNPGANSEILSCAYLMWSPSYYQFQASHLGLWSMLSYCLL